MKNGLERMCKEAAVYLLEKCTQRLPGTAEENVTDSFKIVGLRAEIRKWDFPRIEEQECHSLAVAFCGKYSISTYIISHDRNCKM